MMAGKNDTRSERFASRWSRRKLQGSSDDIGDQRSEQEATSQAAESELELQAQRRERQLAELNALKDEDMPDLDSLDGHSDFSPFMSSKVSAGLRKLALRKLFQGESYNVRDGLDEYDDDYTSFEKLDPTTITADMRHRMEVEAEKRKAEMEQEDLETLADDRPDAEEGRPEQQGTPPGENSEPLSGTEQEQETESEQHAEPDLPDLREDKEPGEELS